MITPMPDLPDGVIGFDVAGEIHADEYRDVLVPAIDKAIADRGDDGVRFVIAFDEYGGISGGAAWEDLKLGLHHLKTWKRIAVITDVEWMEHLVSLFGWMSPGETKVFPLSARDEAIAWVAG